MLKKNSLMKVTNLKNRDGADDELKDAIKPMQSVVKSQFKIGKSINFGVFQKDVDVKSMPDLETRNLLRKDASIKLNNIGLQERDRRELVGKYGFFITALLWIGFIFYDVPLQTRVLGLYFPVSLTYGFLESSKEGL